MSNVVLACGPGTALPGLGWPVVRRAVWQTRLQQAVSGKETRAADWSAPRWKWDLFFELLRNDVSHNEFNLLLDFVLARQGMFDTFLFTDPDDNTVTGQQIGIGDGATVAFQFLRSLVTSGFVEPITALNGTPSLYVTDWQLKQLQYTTARTNLIINSEALNSWPTTAGVTITTDAAVAPDGATTADKIAETAVTSQHDVQSTAFAISAGATIVASGFFKAVERSTGWLELSNAGFTSGFRVQFDLSGVTAAGQTFGTGTVVGGSAVITSMGSGWYRVSIIGVVDASSTSVLAAVFLNNGSSYLGVAGNGLYAWGLDVKQASVLSSYLKTTSSATTRTDYSLSATGLATFAVAPLAAAIISADFVYYFRCRLDMDEIEFSKFMQPLYELKKLSLISVK